MIALIERDGELLLARGKARISVTVRISRLGVSVPNGLGCPLTFTPHRGAPQGRVVRSAPLPDPYHFLRPHARAREATMESEGTPPPSP